MDWGSIVEVRERLWPHPACWLLALYWSHLPLPLRSIQWPSPIQSSSPSDSAYPTPWSSSWSRPPSSSPVSNGHYFPLTVVSLLQTHSASTQEECPKRPHVYVTPPLTKPQASQEALPDLAATDLSDHLAAVPRLSSVLRRMCPHLLSSLGRLPSPQMPVRLSHRFMSWLDSSRKPSLPCSIWSTPCVSFLGLL